MTRKRVAHIVGDAGSRRTVIEVHRRLAGRHPPRVEPVERPHAGIDRHLLLSHSERHVISMGDAVAISDDQRRPLYDSASSMACTVCGIFAPIATRAT